MSILLDSASLEDAAAAAGLGFVGGITTNPTLMRRETAEPLDRLGRLLAVFSSGPVFYQPAMGPFDDMLTDARMAAALAPGRVVVKLPANGDAVRVGAALTGEGIPHALTAVYAPAQALVAHEIGCAWAIPYVDRATRQGVDGLELVEGLAAVLRALRSSTRVLAASLKTPEQVAASVAHGAQDVTAPLAVLAALAEHPLSQSSIVEFSGPQAASPQ